MCFGHYWPIVWDYNKLYKTVAWYIGLLYGEELLEIFDAEYV